MDDFYTPKTRLKDVEKFIENWNLYLSSFHEKKISEDVFYFLISTNYTLNSDKLFKDDLKLFNTIDELENFCYDFGIDDDDVKYITNHEKEHANQAELLGLDYSYGIWMVRHKKEIHLVPFCFLKGMIKPEYIEKVRKAPEDISKYDK